MLSLPLGFSFLLPLPQRWCSLQLISPGVGRRPRSSSAVLPVSSLPTGPSPHSHTHTEQGAARSTPRRVGAAPRHAARPSHSLQVGYLRVAAGGAELGEEGLQVPAASAQIKGRRGSGPARSRGRARRRLAAGGERGQLGDSRPGLRPPGLGDRPRPPRRPRRGANSLLSTVSKCCTRRRDSLGSSVVPTQMEKRRPESRSGFPSPRAWQRHCEGSSSVVPTSGDFRALLT